MAFEQPALEEEPAIDDLCPVDAPFEKASMTHSLNAAVAPEHFPSIYRSYSFEEHKLGNHG